MGTGLNCDVDWLKMWFNIFSKYFIQQVIDLLLIIYQLLAYVPMRKVFDVESASDSGVGGGVRKQSIG